MEQEQQQQSENGSGTHSFPDISADESPTQIESLCMNCREQGMTTLLLTRVPFFKELILMAFHCKHCSFRNNEIQFGGSYEEKGARYVLKVTDPKDMNRQAIKSDFASISIPELEFEIPPQTQRGSLNTIEGFFQHTIEGLEADQPKRMLLDPDVAEKVKLFIQKLEDYRSGTVLPFTFIIDDPSGNSFIENPSSPSSDPNLVVTHYVRTREQNQQLGISESFEGTTVTEIKYEQGENKDSKVKVYGDNTKPSIDVDTYAEDVIRFPATCSICGTHGETRMCIVDIPHFKQVVIMAFHCEKCGYKSNEVKPGGAISPTGKKITLTVMNRTDLARDVLKSEAAGVSIPQIDLELAEGSLGGKFTTVEGLLMDIRKTLKENTFKLGDSAQAGNMETFFTKLDEMIAGTRLFNLVIDDPLAGSYIQNINAPDDDPQLMYVEYERSWQQNEDLGLNDIKTENYGTDTEKVADADAK